MTFPSLTQKQMLWPGASGSGAVPWVGPPLASVAFPTDVIFTLGPRKSIFFFFF